MVLFDLALKMSDKGESNGPDDDKIVMQHGDGLSLNLALPLVGGFTMGLNS